MRAHAELIKRWLDDPDMEIEYLTSHDKWELVKAPNWDSNALYREKPKEKKKVWKWLWAIQIGEETLLSVYFCADKEEVYRRYENKIENKIVILCRIENSRIEVEE